MLNLWEDGLEDERNTDAHAQCSAEGCDTGPSSTDGLLLMHVTDQADFASQESRCPTSLPAVGFCLTGSWC